MSDNKELLKAVLAGNNHRAIQLIDAGADPNATFGDSATTVLHHAAGHGMNDLIDSLIGRGAKSDVRDSVQATPLHWAATVGRRDTVDRLLRYAVDVDARTDRQDTALHRAARHGRIDVARLLLEKGANRVLRNSDGLTPFDLARESDLPDSMKEELLPLLQDGISAAQVAPEGKHAKRAKGSTQRRSQKRGMG